MDHTRLEAGFALKPWIDTKTGDYDKRSTDEFLKALSVCAVDIVNKAMKDGPTAAEDLFSPEKLDLKLSKDLLYRNISGMSLKDIKKLLDDVVRETPSGKMLRLKALLAGVKDVRALRRNAGIRKLLNEIPVENDKVRRLLCEIEKKQSLILAKSFPSADPDKLWDFTIYPKAIAVTRRAAVSGFDAVFWSTLAHDTFHAYHYALFVQSGKAAKWNGAESRVVKESMGVTFEYNYILDAEKKGTITAGDSEALRREMLDEWLGNDVSGWVYSGALGIVYKTVPDHSFTKMDRLIEYSLEDWERPANAIKAGYYSAKMNLPL